MGYIANTETPQEVKNFFTNVKNAFNPKNQYHTDDRLKGLEPYICSFYGIGKDFHIFTAKAFNQPYQYAILTFDKEELNVHCFIDSGPLNVWTNILNYAEI